MNYGKTATEKKIAAAGSSRSKYTTRIVLTFFKTCFVLLLFGCLVLFSAGVGMIKGIIDSAPEVNVDSIVPIGYAKIGRAHV